MINSNISFSSLSDLSVNEVFLFCGAKLKFSKEVTHLGHILSENLDDSADIIRETRHLLRKPTILYAPSHLQILLFDVR